MLNILLYYEDNGRKIQKHSYDDMYINMLFFGKFFCEYLRTSNVLEHMEVHLLLLTYDSKGLRYLLPLSSFLIYPEDYDDLKLFMYDVQLFSQHIEHLGYAFISSMRNRAVVSWIKNGLERPAIFPSYISSYIEK